MERKHLYTIDILRTASIFAVILVHISSVGIRYAIGTNVWIASVGFNTICRWAVPVFFMISGALFLSSDREFVLLKHFSKNVLHIVLCIIIWGFLYSLFDQYLYNTISIKSIPIAIYGIVTGNTGYHLWFLYTLAGLYIAVPIFRIITIYATKRQLEYALGIWLVFSIGIEQINALVEELLGVQTLFPYESFGLVGYAGYFVLGYYLSTYTLSKKTVKAMGVLALITAIVMVISNLMLSNHFQKNIVEAIGMPLGGGSCLIAISVFAVIIRIKEENIPEQLKGVLAFLGRQSFGIYLLHVFFVSILFHMLKINLEFMQPLFSIPLIGIIIYCASLLTTWLLSKNPTLKRIL